MNCRIHATRVPPQPFNCGQRARRGPPPPSPPSQHQSAGHVGAHPTCQRAPFRAQLRTRALLGEQGAAAEGSGSDYATAGEETVVAVVSGELAGAVSIIRLSGSRAVAIAGAVFRQAGRPVGSLGAKKPTEIYYGTARGSSKALCSMR
eukprot:jgi/Tetstr1/449020/TSEL_036245.t1